MARKRIAIMAANENEDIEIFVPLDLWRRAGIDVHIISVEKKNAITLQSGTRITCNDVIARVNLSQYNAIYLPGGNGHMKFKHEHWVHKLAPDEETKLEKYLKKFAKEDGSKEDGVQKDMRYIISMCAAPSVLGEMGLLKDIKSTCFPGFETSFTKTYVDEPVVIDKNFISGRAPGAAFELAFTVIIELFGKREANAVAKQIHYNIK